MPDSTAIPAADVPSPDAPAHADETLFPPQQPVEKTWRRSFWALIITQFQGAFSLNVLRYLLTFMVLGAALSGSRRDALVSLITLLFFIPLVVFSMAGGFLADRFSKRQVTVVTKIIEIVAMAVAIFALSASQQENLAHVMDLWQHPGLLFTHFPLALVVLFIVAMQAALFGPSKYGLLPEVPPEKWLSWGNGVIELGTFLAVIAGTVAGGWLSQSFHRREAYVGSNQVLFAALGFGSSQGNS